MRKTTLKIMVAVAAAAVLMTGCFGNKQAPAEATTAAAGAESAAAESAGGENKDSAGGEAIPPPTSAPISSYQGKH